MSTLIPHGACLLWTPELVWLNAIADALIAAAFFAAAFVLTAFLWRRWHDVMFRGVFWALAIFFAVRVLLKAGMAPPPFSTWVTTFDSGGFS